MLELFHQDGEITIYLLPEHRPGSLLYYWRDDKIFFRVYSKAVRYGQAMVDIGWASKYNVKASIYDHELKLILL